jgi:integrase
MTSTARGSTHQRHTAACPKAPEGGGYAPHKCRGPWAWHLDLGRDPLTGKRQQATGSGFATRREAQAALDEARQRVRVTGGRSEGLTLATWLGQWLLSLRTASPTTVARYDSVVRLHLTPILGHVRLVDLTPEHIDHLLAVVSAPDYRAADSRSRRQQSGLSSASVNRIYDTLSASLGVAVKRRLIPYSPAASVTPPPERNAPGKAWTPEQAAAFLDAAASRNDRLYAAWHLVLLCGARRGEIAGLTWSSLDLDHGVWHVDSARVLVGNTVVSKAPKSAAGTRTVYLDADTIKVLRAHRTAQARERLAAGAAWTDSGYVFTTSRGAPLQPDLLTRAWRAAVEQSRQPVIRLHDGRHTANTIAALYAGVDGKVLIERVGHADVIMNRRYQHVHESVHRQAADSIAAVYAQHRAGTPPQDGETALPS